MSDHSDLDRTLEFPRSAATERAEREADMLVRLVGDRALTELDPTLPAGARFFDWWTRELRDRAGDAEFAARADAFQQRMQLRLAARDHRVALVEGGAPLRPPDVEGTVASVRAQAAAIRCAPVLDLGVAAGAGRELWDEPCTSWVELPDHIAPGQHVALMVRGDSMEPLLHSGDTILVELGPELRRGAVVVARQSDDSYVVKRVTRICGPVLELESLHPGYPPIRIPRRGDTVLGTVLMCWRASKA